jgi:DNA-binding transcriptional MerR regulator
MLLKKLLDPGTDSRLYNRFPNDDARDHDGWRIGKLAEACGVSPDTLRHYERKGVVKAARSANGYRRYPQEAFARIQLVRRALAMGFTLDELGTVLKMRERGGVPCRRVRELAAEKLSAVESQLSTLLILRDELQRALKDWDQRLAQNDPAVPAGLLEALAASKNNPRYQPLRPALRRRNLKTIGDKHDQEQQMDFHGGGSGRDGRVIRSSPGGATGRLKQVHARLDGKDERARR